VTALFNSVMQTGLQSHSQGVWRNTKILIKQYCDTLALDNFWTPLCY
jgi:hypothetical protein